ncbi:MAG TPA: HEAT repeat domain-containing protein [Myxococcaceae bacterium]|nr:HEAT repeat domain-containing protein [Myxococcaceae bacterium]
MLPATVRLLPALFLTCALILPATGRAAGHGAEASAAVNDILRGHDVRSQISRLQYLKAERSAAHLLASYVHGADLTTRRNIALALSFLAGPAELAPLGVLADDADGAVRMYAATALGRAGPKAAEVLVPLLKDKTYGVRREAVRALGRVGKPGDGKAVVPLLREEEELEVRLAALVALGEMKATRQKGLLLEALRSTSAATRGSAARGLLLMNDPQGVAYARERLAGADLAERLGGLELLEGLPLATVAPLLQPLLEDAVHRIRSGAALQLAQAGEKRARLWLIVAAHDAPPEDRSAYTRALETLLVTEAESNAVLRKAGRLK